MSSALDVQAAHDRFPNLFAPIKLRSLTIRNRIVMLPMGSRFARDGRPTAGDLAFLRDRARGGVGLIICGGVAVHPTTTTRSRERLEAFDPAAIPALGRLADEVHAESAAIVGQLTHRGRQQEGSASDWPTWAPSAISLRGDPHVPHEMTVGEIEALVEAYGRAAANLRMAGFDGVEINAAHGYLVAGFLSPQANQRTDRYGGSAANRLRFLTDILDSVRASVDPECVVGTRITAIEGVEGGITLDDSTRIASALATTGQLDYVSVTIGLKGSYVKDMSTPVGVAIPAAAAIRRAFGPSVIVSQRITHPPLAEQALESGSADMVGLARALIADAEWVAKARDGRLAEIRPCVGSIQDCRSGRMACMHNPSAGREVLWGLGSLRPANVRKKVLVVGGGPAGLEAAIQAGLRGHQVLLLDAGYHLGGQVRIAARAPNRTEIDGVISYRVEELHRLGVEVRLHVKADAAMILAERPDAVVVATGAIPTEPKVDGGDLAHVLDVLRVLEMDAQTEALASSAATAAVVDDGSGFWETLSATEALAERGLRVTLLSPARLVGSNIPVEAVGPLYGRLRRLGVELVSMHAVSRIEPHRLWAHDVVRLAVTHRLEEREVAADIVVFYAGKRAVDDLAEQIRGSVPEFHLAGDCVSPRGISEAVYEGYIIGRSL